MIWTYDEDWVKKCMEYRVEGRRPAGRPRKTWLDSVEADMAELEIDKEDVHVVVVVCHDQVRRQVSQGFRCRGS